MAAGDYGDSRAGDVSGDLDSTSYAAQSDSSNMNTDASSTPMRRDIDSESGT